MGNQPSSSADAGASAAAEQSSSSASQQQQQQQQQQHPMRPSPFSIPASHHNALRNLLRPATGALGLSKAELDRRCQPSG